MREGKETGQDLSECLNYQTCLYNTRDLVRCPVIVAINYPPLNSGNVVYGEKSKKIVR